MKSRTCYNRKRVRKDCQGKLYLVFGRDIWVPEFGVSKFVAGDSIRVSLSNSQDKLYVNKVNLNSFSERWQQVSLSDIQI